LQYAKKILSYTCDYFDKHFPLFFLLSTSNLTNSQSNTAISSQLFSVFT